MTRGQVGGAAGGIIQDLGSADQAPLGLLPIKMPGLAGLAAWQHAADRHRPAPIWAEAAIEDLRRALSAAHRMRGQDSERHRLWTAGDLEAARDMMAEAVGQVVDARERIERLAETMGAGR